MDLDEEFDKMYGDTGSAQEDADLDAEFEKAYGQEPSPVPAADDHSTHLPSKNGGEGEVVQMSHEKPGPRAVSTTGGNEEKVEQIAPNLFMKGNLLFDSENRTVKPGQFVVLSRKDGTSQLLSFNGANKNGKPVFEDVRGVSSLGADIAGRIDIGEDDFDTMLAGGKAKRSRSPLEQVRLGLVAETGDEEKYAPGFVGTARAVVDRMLPYAGRHSRDLSMEQLKHLANIHEGKLDGYAGKNDDERLGVAAADAGLDYIRPGETREAYSMRIRAEADEMLKKRSKAKERAGAELGQTEASAFDKIVKGGVESGGYALEFALPGGVFGKAGQVLGMGRKALRVVSALGSAVPVVAAESRSRYVENTTPEYGVDEHGELERYAAPDSESEAAYKAIGGAALDTAVEIGLESATMGLLRLVGKPAGMALGKMTPRAVKDLGERTFNRFMASETGAALRSINRARQDFTSLTQINSPFGELMEENVQAFEKVLNLDGKTSEYKGFEKELKDYWDRQADWDTQWDIFYGLVAQLAIGAAKSTSDGLASRAATADARRDVRMALARSGISEGAINSLTTKQQKVLTEMWRRYSADPDALKDRAKNLGISMRAAVDELTSREGIDMARSLEQRGIAPEKFAVQVGVDGKPAFHRMNRFASNGKSVPMNAMVDEGHGVTIVDQGDGTFYVMNDQRGFTARMADGFAAAKQLADNEVMDNQRRDADNEKKAQYLANLAQGMYTGRDIKVVPTEAALRWGLASAFKNGETPFGLVDASQVFDADGRLKQQGAGGFHTPDGTVVVILDNVASPSEMERVLAHEATGHEGVESNTGRGENTVKFIRNAKADGFERYKAGERARYVSALVRSGMGEEAANAVADEAMSTDSYQKEAMARYAQGRLHRPTWYERKKHEANEKRRADGESVPFDQADMEVMLAKAEEEGRSPGGKFDIGNADSGVRYFETGQEAADETGNVRNEAPAQPEQGSEGPAGGEAARPVEAQPQGGEAPRHGAVEAAKTGAAEAPTAMKTEHDFLRVMHDNQKPVRVPVGEIALPDTQFKEGADPKTGVVKGQELKGEYFESAENAVVVYVRKDGTKELVTGRHRFDLAKRNGKNDILARVFREVDGYTPEDMRNLDAISNIIDEKGTEHDYIRYFENAKPSRAAAEAAGFLSRSKGRLAFELYEGATEGTRAAIDWSGSGADGLISPEQAGIIAKVAPRDAHPRNGAVQRILVKKAQDGLRGDRLAIVARSLAEEAKRRKAPAADGETQLDLFTSEEDLALLALEEKRAARRVQKANEYGRVAGVLQTAMQKGGRLDLNKAYAKELGIRNPKDRKQLADARQKALEKAEYWRNAVRLDEADRAALDAELGIAPKENLELESVTGDQIAEENRKRAEKEEIERRKAAPLKGGAGEVGQSLMDLGGAEGEDLFNRTQRPEPVAEKSAKPTRPVKGTQAAAPKAETAGVMPAAQTRENAPVSAPTEAGATARPKAAKPAEGRKSGDAAVLKEALTAETPAKPVAGGKMTKTPPKEPNAPSFKRGERVLLKGTTEGQRVTFLKDNGDGTADVQVKTPGANRYMPEKAETRTVKVGDIGSSNIKDALSEEENAALRKGIEGQGRAPSVRMKDEAAEKLARQQEDDLAALFDTPELGIMGGDEEKKYRLDIDANRLGGGLGIPDHAVPNRQLVEKVRDVLAAQGESAARAMRTGRISWDAAQALFDALNSNQETASLFRRVFPVAKALGIKYSFAQYDGRDTPSTGGMTVAQYDRDEIKLFENTLRFTSPQTFASTILHETIHGVTVYAMEVANGDMKNPRTRLTPELLSAAKDIFRIYDENRAWMGRDYGATDAYEMIAELSNPRFREQLKKKSVWQRIWEAIKRIFGFKPSNAHDAALNTIDRFVENYSKEVFDSYLKDANRASLDGELLGINTRYSIRKEEPPKKTGIGYKVFVRKGGKLYPPMVANPNGEATPTGVWLNADEGVRAGKSQTGRDKVKAGGKGTNGGGGTLAYRPGWHLGKIPYALQFNVGPKVPNPLGIKNKSGDVIKVGEFFPGNFVWAEVEYAADVDYQNEAMSYGKTASGKFNHALAGLPRIPVDGSYEYRTNANPATDPWIITGAMKVNRVLSNEDVDAIVRGAGRKPQKRETDVVQKFLAWAKKWKFDPSKKSVREEWKEKNGVEVDFDTPEFDPDVFQKRVGAVAKLVKTYRDSGVADFRTLATRMAERFPEKFVAMRPYLRGVWNAVADQMDLPEVSRKDAERVFGIIEAQDKEATDGRELQHRRSSRVDSDGGTTRSRDNGNGPDAGVSAAGRGAENSGGVLAGGRVRTESSDGGVGGVGAGSVPGRTEGRADSGNAEVLQGRGSAGGETAPGNGAVGDSVRPGGSELQDGADNRGDGHNPKLRVKKAAKKAADSTKPNPPRRDFVMTRSVEDAILEKNTAQRVRNNLDAIKLIRDLKARDYAATPEEQATLAKFVGWGGLREKVFGYALERAYDLERTGERDRAMSLLRRERVSQSSYDLHKELRSVLNDSEYESAKASASTAFYTPVDFVRVLHDALRNIGVKGGRFLGPSAGTGNFASAAGEYEKPVNWHFVEKDVMTGEMLKALFPNQRVTIGVFEETKFPDGFFDFAIDNVPYADVPISDRSLSSKMFKIHDYFFAKTLAKLRPGGVMAFLTSTGTLDKTSPILRQFLTEHGGKIVGAVRMPNGFFSENAGTDVASDLVVVQKVQGRPDNSAFEKGVEYGKTEEWVRRKGRIEKPLAYNGYFQNHPEQVIGTMEVASGQFGPTLKYTMPDGASMLEKVSNAVKNAFNGVDRDALLKSAAVAERQDHTPVYDKEGLRQGNVTMKDGKAFIKSGELLEPIALPNDRKLANEMKRRGRTPSGIMEGLLALRKAMRDVIDAQMSESDTVEADLAPLFANLNAVYDAFVQKNGTLHDKWISPFVLLDKADGNRMLALERVEKFKNEKTGKDESRIVKSDIFAKRVISRGQRATKADTPKDALVISYSESGAINVPRIAELLGVSGEEAVKKLKEGGDAFENPQTGLLEPSWVYLSGRVRAKLAAARAAVEAGEESFRANVEALEKVQPPMVRLEDAEIKFGATWVDPECMKDFLRDAFGAENMRISLGKNEVTGQWNVEFGRVMNEDPWGETSWSPQEFVSRVLNHGSMNHYETDPIDKKRHLDERKTEANKLAAEKLHSAFSQFIQSSDKWAAPMYERYNAVMTDMVEIKLPNNVLPFRSAGMSEETLGKLFEGGDPNKPKKGREYQSAVIARGVLGGGSLCLAHCVGAGKTLEMQSIGVLGRHLGLFKKPMYVVPNHMLEQFTNEFVEAFPNANILKMSEADVKPANRRAFFAQVANGDWDAIVVKHSTFSKKLAMSDEYQKEFMEAQRKDLIEAITAMREAGEKISVDQATKKLERLEAKLKKLANAENHDSQIVPFEELGVDQLFVDEAHNFKGMPITTRQGRTGGLSQGDSQRAEDMLMKTQYVQSLHGGDRGVVFATGTPLSNAPVVEAYVMLKYLVPNKLDEQGLKHFDDFVDAFGRITTESEFSTDGKTVKEKDKVSAFVNIPELMKLLRSAVDIVNSDQLDIPRPKPKYHMIDVDMSPAQEQIMEMVAREAAIPPTKEQRNKYLTLTRIAKNACLTPRLLGFEDGGNKIIRAVAEIKRVYDETAAERGAQLVFTDIFNESEKTREMVDAYMAASDEKTRAVFDSLARRGGKSGAYNLNEEIRDLLVAAGIPKEEIAIVQDIDKSKGDKDANKSALFAKVRSGEVRVLIGSRPKMGEGTNVQERLAAIHLLHPGWKPSEDEQAIGRIIRPGNTYKEGQIFYYLTKGNANIGSYETKNHQLIGVKSKLIDQVMHGDDSRREIDMDESAMDRDMLMGLASGNKALMELIDVKKRAHKLELNTESTLTSARRNKDKAEASGRILERKRGEFAQEQEGVKEWREKNDGKPFALTTPDGRSVEKMKDMAELVSGEMTRLLTKDRYDRAERTVLGDFNGVELVLAFDRYGNEKFKLAVPPLGIEREINYSGFVPDFTTAAMTAFKGRILEAVSPDYAKAYENSLNDMERQAKKMSDDADKLQKDYEWMRGELIKLRTRQAQLEREVTPLVVQAVADRKVAAYGNWLIAKPGGGQYVARRESDAKSLSAPTVKELIPLMDAEDFASPRNAATKTADLHPRANANGETPRISKIPVADVDFDTPELSPAEQAYVEAEDKTPTEKVMREVYGMTNDEIATALKAAGMEPPKHVRKTDETTWRQAEALLSNPSYMAKLSSAVAKFPRNIADYENNALNVLFRRRQAAVNAAKETADALKETLDALNAIPKGERDADFGESLEAARREYGEAASRLAQAKALMHETGFALTRSSSEAGRRLRSNRGLIDQTDLSYAGISGRMATALGGADKITPEMDARIREIAKEFASIDEEGRDIATARLKALAEKIVEQIKRGDKVRKATERKQGDEAKRVMRNYNNALAQIEVGAAEVGGTLVGLSDQQYPAWGKWLRAIGEFHCFENPDITEEECVRAIVEDISPFMDGVDENQVRDALTGFGHNFRQSRYDAQRLMNDLCSQARLKRQMDWMDETNTMPPLTGMVRDEPSDTTRNLQKQVQDRKKEVPDAGRDARRLKGVLESAKTRVKNRIADLERAIETRERIPGRDRTVPEDIELRELKKRRDALQQSYDKLFKTERGLTDEQRVKLAERLLGRELEHALEDLDRARSGDFSKRPKRPGVESPSIDALRDRLNEVREQIRELKAAKYEFGMTPEELDAYNARKMANREKALMRLAERIVNGDLRPQKKPQPPMPPEMQKRYDAMGEQMKKARQKLADMRLEAEDATLPSFWRKAGNYLRFVTTAQRALRATMDFSAVLRQAARIMLAHPVMGANAFGKAWNAAHSEANLLAVNDEIMSDPSIQEAVAKYGLHLREVDATSARDVEMFHGMERNKVRIFGKEVSITDIPFFGEFMLKSERHYITYLNAVSAELYSSIVNDRTRFPAGPTAWQKKMLADMINIWNGSAALSEERRQALQKAWVNDILWAPQLAISRIQSATLYDVWHPLVAKGVKNAETGAFDAVSAEERKTMFKIGASEHFKSSLAMIALGALLKWLFADEDDWYDFWQADWFEKLLMLASPKVGNTTIDLTGGEQSVNRAAHKMWKLATSGKVRTGSGRMAEMGSYGGPTVWGVIGRYVQGKTSPWLSELVSLMEGRDYVGNEYTWKDAAIGAAVPLTFEDVKEQLEQNGIGKSLITIPLSLLGAGGSTYDRKVYENAVNRFLESKKEYDAIEQDPLLDEANRELMLDSIVSENPLMREEVREDIAADIAQIRRDETKARKDEKDGNEPDADLLSEIETGKAKLIEKIRSARRR